MAALEAISIAGCFLALVAWGVWMCALASEGTRIHREMTRAELELVSLMTKGAKEAIAAVREQAEERQGSRASVSGDQ